MQELLALPGRRDVLRITVFVTQPGNRGEVRSLSERVRLLPGRPEWGGVVGGVVGGFGVGAVGGVEKGVGLGVGVGEGVGAVGVLVCGPGGMGDEVRGVVRGGLWRGGDGVGREVDFLEEGFGW